MTKQIEIFHSHKNNGTNIQKTVILVDEIYLAKQWCNYILENTDLPPEKLVMVHSKMKKADKERITEASVIVASKDSLFGKAKNFDKTN